MTISAEIIADSISPEGIRLTTMQLRYPRFIHAEFMTHRVFSRNASSSRAIPVERLIEDIVRDTAMPIHWGKNQSGMQAREEHNGLLSYEWGPNYPSGEDKWLMTKGVWSATREDGWMIARDKAIETARAFHKAGYHKQIVNRLLEPFSHINVVVTATEWSNFFALRAHPDAQPEIRELALQMIAAMKCSTPERLEPSQWHLPYVDEAETIALRYGGRAQVASLARDLGLTPRQVLLRCSVARCARVSYLTHDGKKPEIEKDLKLYEDLVGAVPLHASPAEHQATPDEWSSYHDEGYNNGRGGEWHQSELHGNLTGWIQYRKTLPGENQQAAR